MKSALKNYKAIAHLVDARRLLAADAISKAGDWILYVAMSVLVFEAGGAGALSMFTALRVVVPFVLGPWAGRWGAALPPRTMMIIADAARACLLFLAAAAAAADQSAWLLVGLVVGCASVSAFHAPAERRFQRDVIESEQRASFNAVIGATGTTVIVVAPALGGLLTTTVGNVGALVVDAASFLLSLVFVASVRTPSTAAAADPAQLEPAAPASGISKGALATAVRSMRQDPAVMACVMAQAVACTVAGASLVLMPLLGDRLQAGDGAIGWLTAAVGTGSVVGVLIGGSMAKQGRLLLCVTSVVSMGVILGLLGSSPNLLVALLCAALVGVAANIPEPMYWTSYADRVSENDSSSFYGLVESSITGGFALGGVILGAAVAAMGTSTGTWVVGVVGSVLATAAFVPALRHHRVSSARTGSRSPVVNVAENTS
ncbi:MFS transporter [Streptomyces griseorubiginosus]|uniref:MFS transporter n=1 Tax=Streptomyces griseorubiginosus TaxID=67304 RepID=UPI0034550584